MIASTTVADDGGPVGPSPWACLAWAGRAYRAWSLGVFAAAALQLVALGDFGMILVAGFVLVPFGAALGIAWKLRDATPGWIVAFLLLVDLGVVFAPVHGVLPGLGVFPQLPRTEDRILTWYFVVYGLLQFVAAPPWAFARSLLTARRGGVPTLGVGICFFGLAVWSILVAILGTAAIKALLA